ncbi:hypothetical protein Tco_1481204, partial [Tanacetum coccineum]
MIILHHHLSIHLHLLLPHPGFINDELFLSDPGTKPRGAKKGRGGDGKKYGRMKEGREGTEEQREEKGHSYWSTFTVLIPPGGPCRALTARKSVRPLSSHRLALSKVFRRWRYAPLSTPYPPTTSESSLGSSFKRSLDSSSPSSRLSRKRCRSSTALVPLPTHVLRSIALTPANLLPPRKRFRDSYSPEDSREEHMEVDTVDVDIGISEGVIAHPEDGVGMGFTIVASDVRKDDEEFEVEASTTDTREITIDPLAIGDSSES